MVLNFSFLCFLLLFTQNHFWIAEKLNSTEYPTNSVCIERGIIFGDSKTFYLKKILSRKLQKSRSCKKHLILNTFQEISRCSITGDWQHHIIPLWGLNEDSFWNQIRWCSLVSSMQIPLTQQLPNSIVTTLYVFWGTRKRC